MEKIICGNITLFRLECPECGEFNLSGNNKFNCLCGCRYERFNIDSTRIICGKKRENLLKYKKPLREKQNNKCFWCGNEIGSTILKQKKGEYIPRELKTHIDHIIPYSYCKNNNFENLCLSCSICNLWKHSKVFIDPDDCKLYLRHKWDKAIKNNQIIIT